MKKAISLILGAGLVFAGVPGGAAVFGPNTVWGNAPLSASAAANAVLLDVTGKSGGMVPVIAGKFAFRDVPAGHYVVALQTATGQEVVRSLPVDLGSGAEVEALFGRDTAAAVPPGSTTTTTTAAAAAATGGGLGTTGWILIGASAVGITTAVVIATHNDNVASPSR